MLWAELLPVLTLVLPAIAVIGLATQLARAVRRHRLLPADPVKALAELACVAGATGLLLYGVGSWQGHLIDPRSASEICGGQVTHALAQSAIPLHNRCQLADGRDFDLVPGWTNPALAVLLVVVIVCGVLALRARTRRNSFTPVTVGGRQA